MLSDGLTKSSDFFRVMIFEKVIFSIQAFLQEASFAAHLSLPSLIVKLKKDENFQLVQLLNSVTLSSHLQQVCLYIMISCSSIFINALWVLHTFHA